MSGVRKRGVKNNRPPAWARQRGGQVQNHIRRRKKIEQVFRREAYTGPRHTYLGCDREGSQDENFVVAEPESIVGARIHWVWIAGTGRFDGVFSFESRKRKSMEISCSSRRRKKSGEL